MKSRLMLSNGEQSFVASRSRTRTILGFAVLAIALGSFGCLPGGESREPLAPDVPYIDGIEVQRLVKKTEQPMLLEFCVPVGCFRCDEMCPSINNLAQDEADRLTVRRININTNRQLAAQWGVRSCPTYVVVANGQEVGRAEFPTSADLISAMIPHASVMY